MEYMCSGDRMASLAADIKVSFHHFCVSNIFSKERRWRVDSLSLSYITKKTTKALKQCCKTHLAYSKATVSFQIFYISCCDIVWLNFRWVRNFYLITDAINIRKVDVRIDYITCIFSNFKIRYSFFLHFV